MFTGHKAKQAAEAYDDAMKQWLEQGAWYKELIQTTQTFKGSNSPEMVLGPGEAVFYKVTGAALIEDRRGAGHYEGRSSGISIPVGSLGGHTVVIASEPVEATTRKVRLRPLPLTPGQCSSRTRG